MRKIKVTLLALLTGLISICHGEVFYKTGFESQNEPFGTHSVGQSDFTFSYRGSGVTTKYARSGLQSMTPGFGTGKVGRACTKEFPRAISADTLWLEFQIRSEKTHNAYLYLYDEHKKNIGTVSFKYNYIAANHYKNRVKFKMGKNWHHVRLCLKFKSQQFDVYIDDKKIFSNTPFRQQANNLKSLLIGGGSSKDKLTFYDDFYVGSRKSSVEDVNTDRKLASFSNDDKLPIVAINYTKIPPVIDGKLNDACWQNSTCITPFLSTSGEMKKQQQTQTFLSYDKDNLYLAFKCFDIHLDPIFNQLHMIKNGGKRNRDSGIFKDDSVEIFLAPSSAQRFYQIAINRAGKIYDASPDKGLTWNGNIDVGTFKNTKFWTLEIKIPLKDLKSEGLKAGDVWRGNFCRNKPALKETTCWAPTFGSFHNTGKFGKLKFFQNAPVIKSIALATSLADGTNSVPISIKSENDAKLLIQNKVSYENADEVESSLQVKVASGKILTVNDKFIIYSDSSNRKSSRNCGFKYRLSNADTGEIYYSSAEFQYPMLRYSPFRTNFINTASGIYYVTFKDMYISDNSSLLRNVWIQYTKNIAGKFKNCELVIEMPKSLSLMVPGRWVHGEDKFIKNWNPDALKKEEFRKDGEVRNRYTLSVPDKLTFPTKKINRKNMYRKQISLIFLCKADKPTPFNDSITFYTQGKIDGKIIKELPFIMPLTILPEINGKRPKKYPIISSSSGYNMLIARLQLNPEKVEAILGNITQAGFNVFSVFGSNTYYANDPGLEKVKSKGLSLEKIFFPAHYKMRAYHGILPNATEYLKKYPQHKAVLGNGKKLNNVVSLSHLLSSASGEYLKLAEKHVGEIARSCNIITSDHEVPVFGKDAVGFSKDGLEKFKKYAGIKKAVTIESVQSDYKAQWNKFQCKRNADRLIFISRLVKKANPDCLFNVYSGYQHDPPHYGTDWRLIEPAIDYAECGYGRPLAALEATMKAIAPKKLIVSELIGVRAGNVGYSFDNIRLNLFRRITDGNGGLMIFYTPLVDGRFWSAMGDISRLISDYESFFLNHIRGDVLIKKISGFKSKDNLVVLRNTKGERIIFLFNNAAKKKTFEFRNLNRIPGAQLKDYYSGKNMGDPELVCVDVDKLSVKVLVYNK